MLLKARKEITEKSQVWENNPCVDAIKMNSLSYKEMKKTISVEELAQLKEYEIKQRLWYSELSANKKLLVEQIPYLSTEQKKRIDFEKSNYRIDTLEIQ